LGAHRGIERHDPFDYSPDGSLRATYQVIGPRPTRSDADKADLLAFKAGPASHVLEGVPIAPCPLAHEHLISPAGAADTSKAVQRSLGLLPRSECLRC
jgi:hypothetical protein